MKKLVTAILLAAVATTATAAEYTNAKRFELKVQKNGDNWKPVLGTYSSLDNCKLASQRFLKDNNADMSRSYYRGMKGESHLFELKTYRFMTASYRSKGHYTCTPKMVKVKTRTIGDRFKSILGKH